MLGHRLVFAVNTSVKGLLDGIVYGYLETPLDPHDQRLFYGVFYRPNYKIEEMSLILIE